MRVWQVSGGSSSGEKTGWRFMYLDKVQGLKRTCQVSEAPRDGYKEDDSGMKRIVCQV